MRKSNRPISQKLISFHEKYLASFFTIVFILSFSVTNFAQEKKILFLGNSYTYFNDLPELVLSLAKEGGHECFIDSNTPGGCTLSNPSNGHTTNPVSLMKLEAEDWDYVILQEQSQFPVIDYWKENYFYPGAQELDDLIKENDSCSKTMLFMTWGRENGGMQCIESHCSIPFLNFEHMTDSLASSYLGAAQGINASVSPVGMAWKNAMAENSNLDLFSEDGSHPSLEGSYLAACTFYVSIFHESAVGLQFYSSLDVDIAAFLQEVATNTVFDQLDLWNIDTTDLSAAFDYEVNEQTVAFINTSVNADSFFWEFGDGQSDTAENPIHVYENTGLYSVHLSAYHDCDTSSVSGFVNIVLQGISENAENQIMLIKRPAESKLVFLNVNLKGEYTLHIADVNGRTIIQEKYNMIPGKEYTLDFHASKSAFYFLQLNNGESIVKKKFRW